jgi:hypothetical protein
MKLENWIKYFCRLAIIATTKKSAKSKAGKKGGATTGKLVRPCPYCSRELKGAAGYNMHVKKCRSTQESHQMENQSLQDPTYLDPYHL